MAQTLVIATHNPGKAREFAALFAPLGYTIQTLADYPEVGDIAETGTTFFENSALKATTAAKLLHLPTVADDSGLAIDALDGRPGVYSARYAGLDKNDENNRQKVLREMADETERTAHFICVLTVSDANGNVVKQYEGRWDGELATAPRGANGFGYDSLFYLPERGMTAAELDPKVKNTMSHRARALAQLADDLRKGALTL